MMINVKKICLSLLAGSFTVLATAVTVLGGSGVNDIADSVKNYAKAACNNVAIQAKIAVTSVQQYFFVQEPAVATTHGQVMPYVVPERQNHAKFQHKQGQLTSEFLCANSGVLINSNLASREKILRFSEYRGSG